MRPKLRVHADLDEVAGCPWMVAGSMRMVALQETFDGLWEVK